MDRTRVWAVIFKGGTTCRDLVSVRDTKAAALMFKRQLTDLSVIDAGEGRVLGRQYEVVPVVEERVLDALVCSALGRKLPIFV